MKLNYYPPAGADASVAPSPLRPRPFVPRPQGAATGPERERWEQLGLDLEELLDLDLEELPDLDLEELPELDLEELLDPDLEEQLDLGLPELDLEELLDLVVVEFDLPLVVPGLRPVVDLRLERQQQGLAVAEKKSWMATHPRDSFENHVKLLT